MRCSGVPSVALSTIAAIGPRMIPPVAPSATTSSQKRLAENRDLRCAVPPTMSAEFAIRCIAAEW